MDDDNTERHCCDSATDEIASYRNHNKDNPKLTKLLGAILATAALVVALGSLGPTLWREINRGAQTAASIAAFQPRQQQQQENDAKLVKIQVSRLEAQLGIQQVNMDRTLAKLVHRMELLETANQELEKRLATKVATHETKMAHLLDRLDAMEAALGQQQSNVASLEEMVKDDDPRPIGRRYRDEAERFLDDIESRLDILNETAMDQQRVIQTQTISFKDQLEHVNRTLQAQVTTAIADIQEELADSHPCFGITPDPTPWDYDGRDIVTTVDTSHCGFPQESEPEYFATLVRERIPQSTWSGGTLTLSNIQASSFQMFLHNTAITKDPGVGWRIYAPAPSRYISDNRRTWAVYSLDFFQSPSCASSSKIDSQLGTVIDSGQEYHYNGNHAFDLTGAWYGRPDGNGKFWIGLDNMYPPVLVHCISFYASHGIYGRRGEMEEAATVQMRPRGSNEWKNVHTFHLVEGRNTIVMDNSFLDLPQIQWIAYPDDLKKDKRGNS